MATARRQIDLLGYAFLFLPEQFVDLSLIIEHKCASGCKVRIALADPDGTQTQERDALEQLDGPFRRGSARHSATSAMS